MDATNNKIVILPVAKGNSDASHWDENLPTETNAFSESQNTKEIKAGSKATKAVPTETNLPASTRSKETIVVPTSPHGVTQCKRDKTQKQDIQKTDLHGTTKSNALQVLAIKKIPTNAADPTKPERYRLCLSDGEKKQPSAMLATQLNHFIVDEGIQNKGVIQLDRYICNTVSDRKIIIILGVTIVSPAIDQIGDPVAIKADDKPVVTKSAPVASSKVPNVGGGGGHAEPDVKPASNPYMNRNSTVNNVAPRGGQSLDNYQPIQSVNPYTTRWTIRARVTNKREKTYSNARGDGKLFSVDLLDDSGEIRATAFNDTADRLNPAMEIGKVYMIRGGRVKVANRKFSHLNNQYEITFGEDTHVQEVEDLSGVPTVKYDYVDFAQLESMNKENTYVDVLAVVTTVGDIGSILTKKDQKQVSKREIELMDKSRITVRCTLWGNDAENFNDTPGSVISIKAARLSDFNGCSMSVSNNGSYEMNPDSEDAHDLKVWYNAEGKDAQPIKLSGTGSGPRVDRRIMLHQIKDENIGSSEEKPEYWVARATVTYISSSANMLYKACPSPDCNKKVVEESTTEYRCEKCNRTYADYKYRMIPRFSVLDATGQAWISCFSDQGEKIFGKTSQEIGQMKEQSDQAYENAIQGAMFKQFMFKVRAKAETYNDETRAKNTAIEVKPVDPITESKYLITEIKKYM
eukprot:m.101215 g.101215  ORF g.101215 m.101215 type:complete len:689 (+) comp13736_c2_seq1:56-2122(+)